MSDSGAEKLVKQTLKLISKKYELDYSELKAKSKKILKMAKNFDEELLGMMEELLDLSNVSSETELVDFNIEVLKIYCKIKDLDDSGSDKSIRARVWENIEEESMGESESESGDESGDDSGESEIEPEPETEVKKKKSVSSYDPKGGSDEKPKHRVKIAE